MSNIYKSESDWYISNECGVWNVVKEYGLDAFSINISEHIDYNAIIRDYSHLDFYEFKTHVETEWKKEPFNYLIYVIG